MPNWCRNTVIIEGPKRKINEFINKVTTIGETPVETNHFDFEKILPVPEDLNVEKSSVGDLGLKMLTRPNDEDTERFEKMDSEYKARAIKLGSIYRKNIEKHGCLTWYEWCCNNWGTKWNSSATEEWTISENFPGCMKVCFDTAWGPPYELIAEASRQYPDITFRISSDEPGMQMKGTEIYKNGILIEQDEKVYS